MSPLPQNKQIERRRDMSLIELKLIMCKMDQTH